MKLDEKTAEHIVALRGNVHFEKFMESLEEEAEYRVKGVLRYIGLAEPLLGLQARAGTLVDICDAVANAQKTLEEYKGKS